MRLLFVLILFLLSCNLSDIDTRKSGLHKVSSTIKQSQENGVFLYALQVDKTSIHIGGNLLDTIQEAWMETSWRYEKQDGKTIVQKDDHKQLAIRFRKLPTDMYSIWIKRGAKSLSWTAVASGSTTEGKFYVVEKQDAGRENILDSFTLSQ